MRVTRRRRLDNSDTALGTMDRTELCARVTRDTKHKLIIF